MVKKVIKRQESSKGCFVCGKDTDNGLKADFFEMEDGTVIGLATAQQFHQSYPHTIHGGISTALLDEAMGRAIKTIEPDSWGVTLELNLKFKLPVPYGEQLIVIGKITENNNKIFRGEGEILLPCGDVAVTATGVFYKMSAERLINMGADESMMQLLPTEKDPTEIEIMETHKVNRT